jgi:23S rRNA (guanine2445-N2)-methyltransferase
MAEQFFASSPRGLESLLVRELESLGAQSPGAVAGGASFSGSWEVCYRVNLWSRLASRVLWRVAQFDYASENDVYAAVLAIDWPRLFAVERSLRVNVTAQKSPLRSLEFITLRVKDAVCDRFRETTGARPSVSRAEPDVRVHLFLEERRATLYLDTSGEALFKRGWRRVAGEAPLRENLAAGIVMLTGWQPGEAFLDPMCGGGTLVIEAAAMAAGVAPGAERSFGFEKLESFDARLWQRLARAGNLPAKALHIFGSDNEARAIEATKKNLAAAGFEGRVELERADLLARLAPAPSGVMVANPPYGERLGAEDELARFYPKLGDALKKNFAGWRCFFFTADMRLPKLIRLEPAARTPLWNGALECRLYEFRIVSGSYR